MYSSRALSTFTLLYNHHHRPSPELSIFPNWDSVPIQHWPLPSPPPAPGPHPLLSVSVTLTPPGSSEKWDHTVSVLLCPAYFTERRVLKVHPRCSRCQNLLSKAEWYSIVWMEHIVFIHRPLMDTWVASTFCSLSIMLLWTWVCKYHFEILFSVLLDTHSGVWLLDHGVILFLIFEETYTIFRSSCTILHSHPQCTRVPISPHSCQHLVYSVFFSFFNSSHPNGCEVVSLCVLICISFMFSDVEHLFHVLNGHLKNLLWRNAYSNPLPIFILGLKFFCYWIVGVFIFSRY